MLRSIAVLVAGLTISPLAVNAQDNSETLADIRQELAVLYVELQRLNRELNTTGGVSTSTGIGGSVIDRVAAIEGELQRLTSKTEELEFRIDRVVTDGSNRVEDLEFRICELEPGCDVGSIEYGDTLGGLAPVSTGQSAASNSTSVGQTNDVSGVDQSNDVQLAIGEQADFDSAVASFDAGDYPTAAQQFALFQVNYPGSPLGARAGLLQGEALENNGDTTGAARAYLDTFSAAPQGPEAANALFLLGRSLGQLGQADKACVTLSEVGVRFPQSPAVSKANAEKQNLGCL
ncbi:MAG: tol-pal system protein YbgF [Pseudomonadota bacterium]